MIKEITYKNKKAIQNDETIPEENKVTDSNMNEIKEVVNNNAKELEKKIVESNKFKQYLIHTSAEGENINVNDSSDLDASIDVRGNTKQETTEGYNLFDANIIPKNDNLLGLKVEHINGKVILNGTPRADYIGLVVRYPINTILKENGEYSFKPTDKELMFRIIERNKQTSVEKNYFNPIITIDKDKNDYFLTVQTETYSIAGSFDNHEVKMTINLGQPKPYEPYTGGQASPNPDYPQEIENVTGDVEIKQTGKQLFNKNDFTELAGEFSDNNTIINNDRERIIYFKCQPNTTYAFQKKIGTSYERGFIATTTEIPTINSSIENRYNSILGKEKFTYTTNANAQYIVWWYYCLGSDITQQELLDSIQIEIGDEPTLKEEYKEKVYPLALGNIELNGTPELRDRPYKENGKWYWDKKWEKYVFTGEEEWNEYGKNCYSKYILDKKPRLF